MVFKAICFAVSRLGSPEVLSVPVNTMWFLMAAGFGGGGAPEMSPYRPLVLEALATYIAKYHVAIPGVPAGLPPAPEDIEWVVGFLFLTLSKDMRVFQPDNAEVRSATALARLEAVANAVVRAKDVLPASHFLRCNVMLDTFDYVVGSRNKKDQCDKAYHNAVSLLEMAKEADDPLYLCHAHAFVAYLKLTSSNPAPYTVGEIKQHLASAATQRKRCKVYAAAAEFHLAETRILQVKSALENYAGVLPPDDALMRTPILIGSYDRNQGAPVRSAGLDVADKFNTGKYHCSYCRCTVSRQSICSRCKNVAYCNTTCQKAHWKVHKPDCVKPDK